MHTGLPDICSFFAPRLPLLRLLLLLPIHRQPAQKHKQPSMYACKGAKNT